MSPHAVMWSGGKDSALALARRRRRGVDVRWLVTIHDDVTDPRWLGRVIADRFVQDIVATGIDPCGENGEYHSFAFDGPFFSQPVSWRLGARRNDGRFAQVDLV